MPFQSKAQQKWMFANHSEMAREWAAHTSSIGALPEKVTQEASNKAEGESEKEKKAEALSNLLSLLTKESLNKGPLATVAGSILPRPGMAGPSIQPTKQVVAGRLMPVPGAPQPQGVQIPQPGGQVPGQANQAQQTMSASSPGWDMSKGWTGDYFAKQVKQGTLAQYPTEKDSLRARERGAGDIEPSKANGASSQAEETVKQAAEGESGRGTEDSNGKGGVMGGVGNLMSGREDGHSKASGFPSDNSTSSYTDQLITMFPFACAFLRRCEDEGISPTSSLSLAKKASDLSPHISEEFRKMSEFLKESGPMDWLRGLGRAAPSVERGLANAATHTHIPLPTALHAPPGIPLATHAPPLTATHAPPLPAPGPRPGSIFGAERAPSANPLHGGGLGPVPEAIPYATHAPAVSTPPAPMRNPTTVPSSSTPAPAAPRPTAPAPEVYSLSAPFPTYSATPPTTSLPTTSTASVPGSSRGIFGRAYDTATGLSGSAGRGLENLSLANLGGALPGPQWFNRGARALGGVGDLAVNTASGKGAFQNALQKNWGKMLGYGTAATALPIAGAVARGEPPNLSGFQLTSNLGGLQFPSSAVQGAHQLLPESWQLSGLQSRPDQPGYRSSDLISHTVAGLQDMGDVARGTYAALNSPIRRTQLQSSMGILGSQAQNLVTGVPAVGPWLRAAGINPISDQTLRMQQDAGQQEVQQLARETLNNPNADPAEIRRAQAILSPGARGNPQGGANQQSGGAATIGGSQQPQFGDQQQPQPQPSQPALMNPQELQTHQAAIRSSQQQLQSLLGRTDPASLAQAEQIRTQLNESVQRMALHNVAAQTGQTTEQILNDINTGQGAATQTGMTNFQHELAHLAPNVNPQQIPSLWGSMDSNQKMFLVGGLGLALVGLMGAFGGGGGAMSWLGPLLGIAGLGGAAYGLTGGDFSMEGIGNLLGGRPASYRPPTLDPSGGWQPMSGENLLGGLAGAPIGLAPNNRAPQQPAQALLGGLAGAPIGLAPNNRAPQQPVQSASGAPNVPLPSPQVYQASIQQAMAQGDTGRAADLTAQMFRSSPEAMGKYRQLNSAFASTVPIPDFVIARGSGGLLTTQQVGQLRANWPLVQRRVAGS